MKVRIQWSRDTRSKGERAERLNALIKMITTLHSDLEMMDKTNLRIYSITGDPLDPEARLGGEISPGYPLGQSLQAAYDAKTMPIDDETLGLAVAGTAVRHLTFGEVREKNPEMFQHVLDKVREVSGDDAEEVTEQVLSMMETMWDERVVPGLPNPTQLPDNLRVRATVLTVLMRSGFNILMTTDPTLGQAIDSIPDDLIKMSPDMNPMWQYLHGLRPEPLEDPIRAVKDFQMLNNTLSMNGHDNG